MIHGLKPYPEMKDSGVEWMGKVPEHWDVSRSLHQCHGGDSRPTDIRSIPSIL